MKVQVIKRLLELHVRLEILIGDYQDLSDENENEFDDLAQELREVRENANCVIEQLKGE